MLTAFEQAERETDPARQRALLTFVIVGGGPTGVELAGTLAEIAAHTLRREFRRIHPRDARILLVDLAPRVLGAFPEDLSHEAEFKLRQKGVEVRLGVKVQSVDDRGITLQAGATAESISAETVLWAAGVQGSPLGTTLARAGGCELDRTGRVIVQPDLTLPGHSDVFVIGDLAHCPDAREGPTHGKPLPGVAPVAIQQGGYVARLIVGRLRGKSSPPPFRYYDYGNMATIGRSAAVAQLGRWKFRGLVAWLLWLFVHLMQIVHFQNRVLVFWQWAWSYFTFSRSARLITEVGREPAAKRGPP